MIPTDDGEDAALAPPSVVEKHRMAELYRRRFRATPQAVPLGRHEVIDALNRVGLTDATLHARIALALSEATTNAVRHAYPPDHADGHIEVTATRASDSLTVMVKDEGQGMDNGMPPPGSGLRFAIMTSETQDLAVKSDGAGTIVALRFSL
jgi:anti-sigma regulatory factor (Ser/Thr protein kinase)